MKRVGNEEVRRAREKQQPTSKNRLLEVVQIHTKQKQMYVCMFVCVHLDLHQSLRAAGARVGEKSIEVLRISEQRDQGLCRHRAHRGAGRYRHTHRSNRKHAGRPAQETDGLTHSQRHTRRQVDKYESTEHQNEPQHRQGAAVNDEQNKNVVRRRTANKPRFGVFLPP